MIDKIFKCVKENGSIEFIDKFFGIKPTQRDFERFEKFKEALKLKFISKLSIKEISKRIGISRDTISLWVKLKQLPFIVQMLKIYLALGDPKQNWKWLPLNVGFGQTLDGPWIHVPMVIQEFDDIKEVVNQLQPLPNSIKKIVKFFDVTDEERLKLEIFAYVLGFVVGDFGKQKNKKNKRILSRKLSLKLTKRVPTNLLLGEFVTECVKALGIMMKRYKDQVDRCTNTVRFYWESQASIFLNWVFQVCLGLKENETTTLTPVRMDWLCDTPQFFIKRFIQGLGDSDGQVNMQSDCCNIASYPNTGFLKTLIESLGVKTRIDDTPDGKIISMTPKDANKIPPFFPNEEISYRYNDLKAYVKAKRIKRGGRTPQDLRLLIEKYSKQGCRKADIMRTLVHKHQIVVRCGTLSRYYKS